MNDWKIALPSTLIVPTLRWYHLVLGHCGSRRLYDTVRRRFHAPGLKRISEETVHGCKDCQTNKQIGAGYGTLPPKHASLVPWNQVDVDLIGPWRVQVNGEEVEFNALTCIDPVTSLVELIRVNRKTAYHIAQQFENVWLSRYPRPNRCAHDNGGEFIGWEFQEMLQRAGVQDVHTTSRNPQGNSVCERLHQTVGDVLRTYLHADGNPHNMEDANQLIDNALATVTHATRCSLSRAMGNTPGEVVFHRDMFVDLPVIVDLLAMQDKRQALIDENLRRQNAKRREFRYEVGGEVLIKSVDPRKLEPRAHGAVYNYKSVHKWNG